MSWNQGVYVKFIGVNCKFFYLKIEEKKVPAWTQVIHDKGDTLLNRGEKNIGSGGSTELCAVRDPGAFRSSTANRV